MKTEVYAWRPSADMEAKLKAEARRRRISVSKLLDHITGQWLQERRKWIDDDEAEQSRLHAEAAKYIGTVTGLGPADNKSVREAFRQMWAEKRARNDPH